MIVEWKSESGRSKLFVKWAYVVPKHRWWAPWEKPGEPFYKVSQNDFDALANHLSSEKSLSLIAYPEKSHD